jgi:glutamate-5-semialdehyde dehydrogenase
MEIARRMEELGKRAKAAARRMSWAEGAAKDAAIRALGRLLGQERAAIAAANEKDLAAAVAKNYDAPFVDRLRLTDKVIDAMAQACAEVAAMPDPVGALETTWKRPNGLLVGKMRIPLGVIAMIFESRPNVTVDSAILCLKAGNAVVLRGGSEAIHSNLFLAGLIRRALTEAGLPGDAVQVVETTDRAAVAELLKLDQYIDVIIPRGGEGLIRAVVEGARMPVLKHYKGVCHVYVDKHADLDEALDIVFNAKCQRPGVCNAAEGLLVHTAVAFDFLPRLGVKLGEAGVQFRACPHSLPLLGPTAVPLTDADKGYEFHDLILAVQAVGSQDEAQDYIAAHGSNHTEAIVTRDHAAAMRFLREVDASLVLVNASTRFNDGGELGLGAEIGICTSKLHAYGVMGVRELTTTKFVCLGEGQVRG